MSAVLCLLLALSAAAQLRVGRITIQTHPVFAGEEARGGFYRAVNVLHVQTPETLIRAFLLFREGDPFDPAKLAESERNLRQFAFLTTVSVTASPPHDGVVDVAVVTEDAWTTDVTGDFSNEGGIDAYNVDVSQQDLWGTGSALDLRVERDTERRSNAIEFTAPSLLGRPYWNVDALYSHNSDGNEEKLAIERPLFSYTTPWTAGFLFDHLLRNERVFRGGYAEARFRQQHRALTLWRSHVLHKDESSSAMLVGGIDVLDDSFSDAGDHRLGIRPEDRHFRFIDAGYELTGFRFLKLDYVDRDLLPQDFNLGAVTTLHAAISPRFSADRPATWRVRASASRGHAFDTRSFVIGEVSATSRGPRNRNAILSLDAKVVKRFDTRFPQAFVARARVDLGSELDYDMQFFADGQHGLRAYPDFAFEGRRRILLNVEQRLFLGRELLHLFGPGVVAFADSGDATDRAFHHLKSDAGVGLRIGIARYNAALIRIDYAYAFDSSPLSRPRRVVSISTTQAF